MMPLIWILWIDSSLSRRKIIVFSSNFAMCRSQHWSRPTWNPLKATFNVGKFEIIALKGSRKWFRINHPKEGESITLYRSMEMLIFIVELHGCYFKQNGFQIRVTNFKINPVRINMLGWVSNIFIEGASSDYSPTLDVVKWIYTTKENENENKLHCTINEFVLNLYTN